MKALMEHVGRRRSWWIYRVTNGKLFKLNCYKFRMNAEKKNTNSVMLKKLFEIGFS